MTTRTSAFGSGMRPAVEPRRQVAHVCHARGHDDGAAHARSRHRRRVARSLPRRAARRPGIALQPRPSAGLRVHAGQQVARVHARRQASGASTCHRAARRRFRSPPTSSSSSGRSSSSRVASTTRRSRSQQIRDARPSPDGKRLAFTALDRLWVMDLPSGKPRRLTRSDVRRVRPAWSPDGRHIAYVTVVRQAAATSIALRSDGTGAAGDSSPGRRLLPEARVHARRHEARHDPRPRQARIEDQRGAARSSCGCRRPVGRRHPSRPVNGGARPALRRREATASTCSTAARSCRCASTAPTSSSTSA